MANATYVPSRDIPDVSDKVFLVTGGTAGLGQRTIEDLVANSAKHICFVGRNVKKAAAFVDRLEEQYPGLSVRFIQCDMASLASVKRAAGEFLAAGYKQLDRLICSAGIMCADAAVTEDGYQVEWQTNHLAHALLIKLLLPLLRKTASKNGGDVRIVSLASQAYQHAPRGGIDFATLNTPQKSLGSGIIPGPRWSRYGQSKLANLLYADALAREYPEVLTVSLHPGNVITDIWRDVPFFTWLPAYFMIRGSQVTVEEGAHSVLWAATAPRKNLVSGTYYEPVGVAVTRKTELAKDENLAAELWEWTQKALEKFT